MRRRGRAPRPGPWHVDLTDHRRLGPVCRGRRRPRRGRSRSRARSGPSCASSRSSNPVGRDARDHPRIGRRARCPSARRPRPGQPQRGGRGSSRRRARGDRRRARQPGRRPRQAVRGRRSPRARVPRLRPSPRRAARRRVRPRGAQGDLPGDRRPARRRGAARGPLPARLPGGGPTRRHEGPPCDRTTHSRSSGSGADVRAPFARIVCGASGTRCSRIAVEQALEIAGRRRHGAVPGDLGRPRNRAQPDGGDRHGPRRARARRRAAGGSRRRRRGLDGAVPPRGSAARPRRRRRARSDLLVLGGHVHSRGEGLFLGSAAVYALHAADGPRARRAARARRPAARRAGDGRRRGRRGRPTMRRRSPQRSPCEAEAR